MTIALVLVAAVLASVFLFRSVYRSKNAPKAGSGLPLDSYTEELQKNRADLKTYLGGGKVDDALVYRAVIQLGEVKDSVALEAALKLKDSSSRYFREGAAQSLGYYETSEAESALKTLTTDKEPSVRAFAIQALGRSSSDDRRQELDSLQEKGGLTDEELIALNDGKYKSAKTNEEREAVLVNLAKLTSGKKTSLSSQAALKMVELAPESPHTREVLHRKVSENSDTAVMGTGIRTLASQRDPWISPKLEALSSHESPIVRKAAVQSLHRICPPNRWAILSSVAQHETDPSVIEVVIDEALLIPEKNIETFLEALSDLPLVKKYEAKQAEAALKRVRTEKIPNACLGH
jgi:HEAT repeat protein